MKKVRENSKRENKKMMVWYDILFPFPSSLYKSELYLFKNTFCVNNLYKRYIKQMKHQSKWNMNCSNKNLSKRTNGTSALYFGV